MLYVKIEENFIKSYSIQDKKNNSDQFYLHEDSPLSVVIQIFKVFDLKIKSFNLNKWLKIDF
jgi:hypothetical protein